MSVLVNLLYLSCFLHHLPNSDTKWWLKVETWCPVEDDRRLLGPHAPLITGSENHTAFIKNSIRFSYFGDTFHRNNMPSSVCLYNFSGIQRDD